MRLFRCFLDTRLMLCRPENPNPLRADEEVLELVPGGGHRRKQPSARVKPVDPLHQLFLPDDPRTVGGLSCVPHVPAYIMDAQIFYIHVYIHIYICVCNVSPCTMYVSCTLHGGPIQFQHCFHVAIVILYNCSQTNQMSICGMLWQTWWQWSWAASPSQTTSGITSLTRSLSGTPTSLASCTAARSTRTASCTTAEWSSQRTGSLGDRTTSSTRIEGRTHSTLSISSCGQTSARSAWRC